LHCYFCGGLDTPFQLPHTFISMSFYAPFYSTGAGMTDMRSIQALLRSTKARIGRRLAEIAAIAAASLPAVGV
jgi:hypothetical protein